MASANDVAALVILEKLADDLCTPSVDNYIPFYGFLDCYKVVTRSVFSRESIDWMRIEYEYDGGTRHCHTFGEGRELFCTRDIWHEGLHIAHNVKGEVLAVWPQEFDSE